MNQTEEKPDTKQRILDSAERLFADHGFEASSMRTITADAKVNLAAIHYHYHSKEALLEAVILRRIDPINRERLRMLDECEQSAVGGRPSLEGVLEAFLAPPFRVGNEATKRLFARLVGRVMSENSLAFRRIFERHFREIGERFVRALHSAVPELSPEETLWRLNFTGGALAHLLRTWGQEDAALKFLPGPMEPEAAIRRLVDFSAAGFRAPAPNPTPMEVTHA